MTAEHINFCIHHYYAHKDILMNKLFHVNSSIKLTENYFISCLKRNSGSRHLLNVSNVWSEYKWFGQFFHPPLYLKCSLCFLNLILMPLYFMTDLIICTRSSLEDKDNMVALLVFLKYVYRWVIIYFRINWCISLSLWFNRWLMNDNVISYFIISLVYWLVNIMNCPII